MILSTHILAEVEISCDRILILNQGHLVAQGTAEELREEFLPGSHFQFEADGPEIRIREVLSNLGEDWDISIEPISENGFQKVSLQSAESGKRGENILKDLVSSENLKIRSFRSIDPSLEDIFLVATRRSWELPPEKQELPKVF